MTLTRDAALITLALHLMGVTPSSHVLAVAQVDVARTNSDQILKDYEARPEGFQDHRLLDVAASYAKAGRLDQARVIYELMLRDHPSDAKALRGLGNTYYLQKHYDRAVTYLRRAWESGEADGLAVLAASHLKAGRPEDMDYLLPDLLKHKQGDPEIVNMLIGYVLDMSRRRQEPPNDELLIKAIDGLPDQEFLKRDDTTMLVSEALHRFGEFSDADAAQSAILRKITRGYEADPQRWPPRRRPQVADAYRLQGEGVKAERLYRALLEQVPDDVDLLRGLGILCVQQRRFSEGMAFLRQARRLGDDAGLSCLAASYLALGDLEGMKDLLSALDEGKAQDPDLRNLLIMYALKPNPPNRELFFRAIQGISDEEIVRRDDMTSNVVTGLKLFGDKERAERLLKLKKEQAKPKKA